MALEQLFLREKLSVEDASVVISYMYYRDAALADELVRKFGANRSFVIKADVGGVAESAGSTSWY